MNASTFEIEGNYCPNNLSELHLTARNRLKSAQKRPSIIAACWMQLLFGDVMSYGSLNRVALLALLRAQYYSMLMQ